jgi:2-polyprenyl-3-methyl-5-hydroxy-6-metoxy-1,4-benzoquinol methylase
MPSDDQTRWDAKWGARDEAPSAPSGYLDQVVDLLPSARPGVRALDVAGGGGRNALWLAARGYDVTVVDVSSVGLALAERRAAAAGLALHTEVRDLERDGLPPGTYDVILSVYFLDRPMLATVAHHLTPEGVLVLEHPTVTNLERHERPSRRWLLEPGEVPSLLTGLELIQYEEDWNESGRHEARVVARRR